MSKTGNIETGIRKIGDWITDFNKQRAYRLCIHGDSESFECIDFRTRDAVPSKIRMAELPRNIREYLNGT